MHGTGRPRNLGLFAMKYRCTSVSPVSRPGECSFSNWTPSWKDPRSIIITQSGSWRLWNFCICDGSALTPFSKNLAMHPSRNKCLHKPNHFQYPCPPQPCCSILISWLHVRTRADRECRLRGLRESVSVRVSEQSCDDLKSRTALSGQGDGFVPGPLTLRMMLRVVSSMNSTRT